MTTTGSNLNPEAAVFIPFGARGPIFPPWNPFSILEGPYTVEDGVDAIVIRSTGPSNYALVADMEDVDMYHTAAMRDFLSSHPLELLHNFFGEGISYTVDNGVDILVFHKLGYPCGVPPAVDPDNDGHGIGLPCPHGFQMCHYHLISNRWCHIPWISCPFARSAIKSAYMLKRPWEGAPLGWNEIHEGCIDTEYRCAIHQLLEVKHLASKAKKQAKREAKRQAEAAEREANRA